MDKNGILKMQILWHFQLCNTFYVGHIYSSINKDCDDFIDDSGGLITRDFEIRVLTYIHYKISNIFDYYKECLKIKEPEFDFSTIM